jgi:hypothetical protein
VRFTIDRVVLDGIDLSPLERTRLSDTLRMSLEAVVRERLSADGHAHPTSRQSDRERVAMPLAADARGAGLGRALGPVLGASVWPGASRSGGAR